ncbi:MAG: protein kinase [Candidatus Solibacter sp.]
MTAAEWERVKSLFSASLAVSEAQRAAFLADACGDRKDLLRTLEELLANHAESVSTTHSVGESGTTVLNDGDLVAGRYRVVRFMAHGGMGEVYEIFDERLKLRLALKTLRSELLSDRTALARFERELLIARDVSHENLCRLYDLVEHDTPSGPVPCLTMELLDGESLAERLSRERPLDLATALEFAQQIGRGLAALHDHGIIHRDLKPSNVMLATRRNRPQQAIVTDFGLAKAKDPDRVLFESQPDVRAGAPYFMAPELLRREDPSIASDVYAFGLIVDEMVTTRRAYSSESLHALYFSKLWERPTPPRERANNLPAHWNSAILRCLEIEPEQRFGSVAEIAGALEGDVRARPRPMTRRMVFAATVAVPVLLGGAALRTLAAPQAVSIGVFDIDNRTDHEFDYLCRGTITELIRRLGQVEGIEVMRLYSTRDGATSAGTNRFALDGVMERQDSRLHLRMQLFDKVARAYVWSHEFVREVGKETGQTRVLNLLELQGEIAGSAVEATEHSLGVIYRAEAGLRRRFRTGGFSIGSPTMSNSAFDHFLRGQTLLQESTPASLPAAVESFERAVAEDSRFALAYAGLAHAYLMWLNYDQMRSQELAQKARQSAERAINEDPSLPEGHVGMAGVQQYEWNWEGALQSFDQALRLKPRFPRALRWRAGLLLQFGRFDEAVAGMYQALALDPYDRTASAGHGLTLLFAGRVRDSIRLLEEALEGREMVLGRFNLGQAYARHAFLLKDASSPQWFEKALRQAEMVALAEGKQPKLATQMFALFHSLKGDLEAAAPYVRRMEDELLQAYGAPVRLAWMYSVQGAVERALNLLERALVQRDPSLIYVRVNPFLENSRSHPRFQAVVSAMRLN